jgi:hypothetical protein
MPDTREARMSVSGADLTSAQSMAVRVAISNMLLELSDPDYLKRMGRIGELYVQRLSEVQSLILREAR